MLAFLGNHLSCHKVGRKEPNNATSPAMYTVNPNVAWGASGAVVGGRSLFRTIEWRRE